MMRLSAMLCIWMLVTYYWKDQDFMIMIRSITLKPTHIHSKRMERS